MTLALKKQSFILAILAETIPAWNCSHPSNNMASCHDNPQYVGRQAVTQLEAAVKLPAKDVEFLKLALALNEIGDAPRMLKEFEEAVKCNPRHTQAWYNLVLARSGQGDDTGALAALVRAESADPSDTRVPMLEPRCW